MSSARPIGCLIAACGLALASVAVAQTVPVPLPPPADLTRPQAPIKSAPPMGEIRSAPEAAIPAEAESTSVSVTAIAVDGNTVYDAATLAADYAGLIGRQVTLADIFRAAARIEARYRRDGYVLARAIVPAQTVEGGAFRVHIVEGYIDAVQLSDADSAGDAAIIRRYLDPVIAAKPARIDEIERALLLINRLPGVVAHAVLTPETGVPGAARLVIDVHRQTLSAFATINNRGSHFAGPITGSVGGDFNLPGGAHVGGLLFSTFNSEQNYEEVSADERVGGSGLRLRGWLSNATTHPGSILAPLDIRSRSQVGGVGADYPVVLLGALSLSARGSLEVTEDRTSTLSTPASEDRQRVLRLGIDLQAHDRWQGLTNFSLTAHHGLDVFDASHDGGSVPQSRLGGRADFLKLTGTASRYQPLAALDAGSIAVQLSLGGQCAADKLLALEKFHVGGEEFGRGFNPSQFSGDDGVAESIEMQFTPASHFGPFTAEQLYAFFDAAAVHDRGIDGWTQLRSAGGGMRVDLGAKLSGQFEVAVPYRGGRQDGARLDRSAQYFFRLTARY